MPNFDLTPEAEMHFPSHGWLRSCTGIRHLRLPVLRLYQHGQPTYNHFVAKNLGGFWLQSRSPYRTLRQLAVGLRDLHRETRETLFILQQNWDDRGPSPERDSALTKTYEGYERIEFLLIGVFALLRRLADELIDTSNPFLFQCVQGAPRDMKGAVKLANDGKLNKLKPICDIEILIDALTNHTGWLNQLREKDGIRDILIHNPHILQVSNQGTKEPDDTKLKWQISAQLITKESGPGSPRIIDIFPSLVNCLAGACQFMDRLYSCATHLQHGHYQKGDLLFLNGSDNDVVGFWPPIQELPTEFPLTS